jgi:hypothetical protein
MSPCYAAEEGYCITSWHDAGAAIIYDVGSHLLCLFMGASLGMNEKSLRSIEGKYRDFLKHANPMPGGGIGWEDEKLSDVILETQKICENVSVKSISGELISLAKKLHKEANTHFNHSLPVGNYSLEDMLRGIQFSESIADTIGDANIIEPLKDMIQTLQSSVVEATAYVFVSGVFLEESSVTIGGYGLYQSKSGPLPDLFKRKDQIFSGIGQQYTQDRGCYVVIQDLKGDSAFIYEEAPRRAEPLIDILNFFLASCRRRRAGYHKIEVGEHGVDKLTVFAESKQGEVGLSGRNISILPHDLNTKMIENWKKQGLERILQCFNTKGADKSLEGRMHRAIHWYSKAMNADTQEEQFVNLATALESLLISDESKNPNEQQGSISQKLANRVAFLIGSDKESRINYAKKTKDLYGRRGDIVHNGATVTENRVAELDEWNALVRRCILALLRHPASSWDQFLEWITDQIYSIPQS